MEFPLKPIVAAVFAIAMGLLVSGCAGTGSAGNPSSPADSSGASSGGSGVTVFGTIDAGVSKTSNPR
jgi:hypothetical protein